MLIHNMAQKRTDTTTQFIRDIINEDIEEVIDTWRETVVDDPSLTERQIVEDLAEQLHWQFNSGDIDWGFRMLNRKLKDKLTYDIINAIEDLYYYEMSERHGCYIEQPKLDGKIGTIYYFVAEETMRQAVVKEELNEDYFEF